MDRNKKRINGQLAPRSDAETVYRMNLKFSKFEYIDNAEGKTQTDGYIYVMCKDCGYIFRHTGQLLKPSKKGLVKCNNCENIIIQKKKTLNEIEKRKRKTYKENQKILRLFDLDFEQAEMKKCLFCGSLFVGKSKYCSSSCGEKQRNRNSDINRRIRLRSKLVDKDISLSRLYERDNGTCYLCGCKCSYNDYTKKDDAFISGNTYPTIEHIIPLSKGGEHSWDNVKLACFKCNTIKGAKMLAI